MLRNATRCLHPAVKQASFRSQYTRYMLKNVYLCPHRSISHHLLATNGTWHLKTQYQSPHKHHHRPFTIARMTGGSIFQSSTSLGVTPLPLWALPDTTFKECHVRLYSTKPPSVPSSPVDENHNETKTSGSSGENDGKKYVQAGGLSNKERDEKKMSLVQKFKLMYKQYWYVLIPVHIVTSVVWYGAFFIAAKSGVDIVPILEKLGAGEKILSHLQNSNAGYYAIAYAMYKIATPARYTITIGGTTIAINYLKKYGYIRPVPSSEKLKEMYEGKREELIEKKEEIVGKYQEKKGEMVDKYQERREEVVGRYQERREEVVGRYQERKNEMVQRVTDKRKELRGKVSEKREEFKDRLEEKREKLGSIRDRSKWKPW
ncbi:uncharacterized protein C18orf19 homolog A-like isoform X1 [Homarus americanus]|uniref:uncharacterized protein C18orf19 homolog A-like isoform X1 n=2 Tax=Homarus americanus TaxID=6706 RepID=UPI001C44ECDA|nr:uncharacterized protein C18orf19 homolog A-like isoform X1 [Homarus americanus]XP_042242326.1 uncharacterized protein C18orf19 homolog A-like isoform X1 [Homarus americanus]